MILVGTVIPAGMALRVLLLLGALNFISMAFVLLTCRCVIGNKVTNFLWKFDWYKRLYGCHCWFWAVLILSCVLHGLIAFDLFWPWL